MAGDSVLGYMFLFESVGWILANNSKLVGFCWIWFIWYSTGLPGLHADMHCVVVHWAPMRFWFIIYFIWLPQVLTK